MRVKTFRGTSAALVMAQIKKELGPEAVILSNQTRRENGMSYCEIMAAVDQDLEVPKPASEDDQLPQAARSPRGGWEKEWCEIKGHLSALLKPHLDLDALPPRLKMAMQHLEREEVEEPVLTGLFLKLKGAQNPSLLAELGRVATVKPYGEFRQKFQLMTGPSGAGKTSALLRMALAAKQAHPSWRIGIVNCDERTAGGKSPLKRSADLSGIQFADAADPEDFDRILIACRNFDAIFVDLPALPQGQTLETWLRARSLTGRDDVAAHLALPPHFTPAHYARVWEQYRCQALQSVVWTKLDEAGTFGSLINVGRMTELPASAFCFGPGLTGTMAEAASQAMWKIVFSHQMPGVQAPASQTVEQAA